MADATKPSKPSPKKKKVGFRGFINLLIVVLLFLGVGLLAYSCNGGFAKKTGSGVTATATSSTSASTRLPFETQTFEGHGTWILSNMTQNGEVVLSVKLNGKTFVTTFPNTRSRVRRGMDKMAAVDSSVSGLIFWGNYYPGKGFVPWVCGGKSYPIMFLYSGQTPCSSFPWSNKSVVQMEPA